jgi:hypothetical protein
MTKKTAQAFQPFPVLSEGTAFNPENHYGKQKRNGTCRCGGKASRTGSCNR